MPDPVITEEGEPVAIELLYYRHRQPILIEVGSLEDGRTRAESIEDYFEGSAVALVVDGEIRELLGYSAEHAAEALAEARRLEECAACPTVGKATPLPPGSEKGEKHC